MNEEITYSYKVGQRFYTAESIYDYNDDYRMSKISYDTVIEIETKNSKIETLGNLIPEYQTEIYYRTKNGLFHDKRNKPIRGLNRRTPETSFEKVREECIQRDVLLLSQLQDRQTLIAKQIKCLSENIIHLQNMKEEDVEKDSL